MWSKFSYSYARVYKQHDQNSIVSMGKEDQWVYSVAQMLDCALVQLPITYLGVPLGANMRRFSSWQCIIEKIQKRLGSWKTSCISRAGRLVLIKAVLNSLPLYSLSIFKIPRRVVAEIIKIQRRFLWNGRKWKSSYGLREMENITET